MKSTKERGGKLCSRYKEVKKIKVDMPSPISAKPDRTCPAADCYRRHHLICGIVSCASGDVTTEELLTLKSWNVVGKGCHAPNIAYSASRYLRLRVHHRNVTAATRCNQSTHTSSTDWCSHSGNSLLTIAHHIALARAYTIHRYKKITPWDARVVVHRTCRKLSEM